MIALPRHFSRCRAAAARAALALVASSTLALTACFPKLPLEKFPDPPRSSEIDGATVARMKELFARQHPALSVGQAAPLRGQWTLVRNERTGIMLRRMLSLTIAVKAGERCFVVIPVFAEERVGEAWAEPRVVDFAWLEGNLPQRKNAHLAEDSVDGMRGALLPCTELGR